MFGIKSFRAVITVRRMRERMKRVNSKGKLKAGGRIASDGQQRPAKAQAVKKSGTGDVRKPVEMKNTLEMTSHSSAQLAATSRADAEELFEPQEWESLLNSFESETQAAAAPAKTNGEIELSSDDLWERLSSTRWLREPANDIDRASTLTDRPSS